MHQLQWLRSRCACTLTVILSLACLLTAACKSTPQKAAEYINRGKAFSQKGQYSRALLEFQNAAKLSSSDAEPAYQLAVTYLSMRNVASAVTSLRKAVQLNPKHAAAQTLLAELLAETPTPDLLQQAKARASAVVKADPANINAWNALAVAELKLGSAEDAEKNIEQALQRFPTSLKASATLASIKLAKRDYPGAEAVMKEAVRLAPQSVDCALALGQFYTIAGKLQLAEVEFQRAAALDTNDGRPLFELASVQDRIGRYDDAEQTLKRLSMFKEPAYAVVYGDYLFRRGSTKAAAAEFLRLNAVAPHDTRVRSRLATTYLAMGKRAEAASVIAAAIQRNPKDSDALVQRAGMEVNDGKLDQAEADLNQALQQNRDSASPHALLAEVYRRRNQRGLERHELEDTLRLDSTLLKARLRLAHALTLDNAPRSALALLDHTPAGQAALVAVAVERNDALYALGEFDELRQVLARNLAVSHEPMLYLQDGLLKIRLKDYPGGRKSLEEVLRQNPQEWRALDALAATYAGESKPAEAVAVARKHTASYPRSAQAQLLLSRWLLRAGNFTDARATLDAVRPFSAAQERNSVDLALAEVDVAENKLDDAGHRLSAMLAANPDDISAAFALAQVEEKSGHNTAAIRYYEKIVQADPGNLIVLNNLAYLLVDTGTNLDRGLQLAQEAHKLAPDDASIDDTIGWAYLRKGLSKTAVQYLSKNIGTGSPVRKTHLALAYIQLGDTRKARELLQSALSANPVLREAQAGMALLRKAAN